MPNQSNRLINETSPYLLQHAHNPVDWYPWGEEALEKARSEDKPIFLSIGYSACHWCHVMEHESFEDKNTASVMNNLFVNIKVDREERPDLDAIYMEAVQAMTQHGGWPMSVFLTPEGHPFYGGTYYPPEPRYGMPSFYQVLMSVADAYENRREQVGAQAQKLTDAIGRSAHLSPADQDLSTDILDGALAQLQEYFDEEDGGFGSEPKFPQPMTLDFAMSQHKRTGSSEALYIAELTLAKMAHGGVYDQLGGGFHRYSVDSIWLVPHFEKMLYDNSQLLRSYLQAWQITGKPLYRRILDETINYVLREMMAPKSGGFYSTQDADSEGEEGKFFVWKPDELEQILGEEPARFLGAHYGVSQRGNFEGSNILNITMPIADVAQRLAQSESDVSQSIENSKRKLFIEREKRIKPGRDEKILTEWNGLMIHALAECGVTLGREDALEAAQNAANFVLAQMSQEDGKLFRSWTPPQPSPRGGGSHDEKAEARSSADSSSPCGGRLGGGRLNAYLEDYAAFIRGLIALYEATFDLRWLAEAVRLTQLMIAQFGDGENPGFFQTGIDHEKLVVRRKDFVDNAIPSGNSIAAEVLLRLSVLTGNDEYRKQAGQILLVIKEAMSQQPTGFGRMLSVLNAALTPSQEIAVVGDPSDAKTQALLAEIRKRYLPNTVVALRNPAQELDGSMLPLLEGRELVDGQPAAYVCENYACKLPVTEAGALGDLLDA